MRREGKVDRPESVRSERRANYELRELLGELLVLTGMLARKHSLMTGAELETAEERVVWLAQEIYRAATEPVRLGPAGSRFRHWVGAPLRGWGVWGS